MKKYKYYIVNYDRYIVFVPEGAENALTRRLYKSSEGKYYFRYKNKKIEICEEQLYW